MTITSENMPQNKTLDGFNTQTPKQNENISTGISAGRRAVHLIGALMGVSDFIKSHDAFEQQKYKEGTYRALMGTIKAAVVGFSTAMIKESLFLEPPQYEPPRACAPLTLVRSERQDVDLKISLLCSDKFSLINPTFPWPEELKSKEYTWNVHVNKDKTLDVTDLNKVIHKIKMIWWETIRKGKLQPFDVQNSTCIRKAEIAEFLGEVLTKKEVKPSEQEALIAYWKDSLAKINVPYFQVYLADPEASARLLPSLKVASDSVHFDVHRLYFRFAPVKNAVKGISKVQYLEKIAKSEIGKNALIDLGGEVVDFKGRGVPFPQNQASIEVFIKRYIMA